MLEECRVILPYKPNRVCLMDFTGQLATLFGGYTYYDAVGAWRDTDTGKLDIERVRIYDIAIPPGEWPRLKKLALDAARSLRQKTVYLRRGVGDVLILSTKEERP